MKTGRKDLDSLLPTKFEDLEKIQSPTLGTIRKYQGDAVCRAAISHLVYWVRDSFNFARNITDIQAATFADLLMSKWYALTLADIKLCFSEGIMGSYGKNFQNIDPTTLFDWVETYFNKKDEFLTIKAQTAKKEAAVILTPEQIKERLDKMGEALKAKKVETQKSSLFYRSLSHYCEVNEKDLAKVTEYLRSKYAYDYSEEDTEIKKAVPVEAYIQFRIQRFLINKTKSDAGRIIEKESAGITITLDEYKAIKESEKQKYFLSKKKNA